MSSSAYAILVVVCSILPVNIGFASETTWDINELLRHRSTLGEVEATFIQEKRLPEIETPIVSSGTLKFTPPEFLQMSIEAPKAEIFTINGTRASVQKVGSDRVRSFPVRFAPPLEAIGIGLRGTLGGNLATMEEKFAIEFSGTKEEWQMSLVPKQKKMKRRIKRIELSGEEFQLKTFFMNEADGTTTKMDITELL